jgi:intracellular multiplication protein IcmO
MKRRGLNKRDEQDSRALLRDTRTIGQRISDFYHNPLYMAVVFVMSAVTPLVYPAVTDVVFLFGLISFLISYNFSRQTILPFRLPQVSNELDYNDLYPSSTKPRKARGIAFYGNDLDTGQELWFNNDDMRTHTLIFGSTGSGKTEALLSLAYNALVQASGFIYVDGKGDNSLFSKVFSMTRRMGRDDDLLLVNFMTGAKDIIGPQPNRISNTMNPFASGSSSMLSQLVVSLMDASSASPDGDMWKGRAISFVEALMRVLVYARDQGIVLLDANTIRNYFILDRVEAIVVDRVFPRDNEEPISLETAPSVVIEPLKNYLINLPGYDKTKKGAQSSQVLEQHGFITMQLTRVFSSLADTYGHILRTNLAEVDMKDVVLNRRILVVLLPALEKSPDELAALGKVIIATLKAMMAAGLGSTVEGTYGEVIDRKPTNSKSSFMCILDEYGYYAVPGFAVVPAQARSLGFSVVFAGQDLPAFQKASKEEAASIGANTNIKICMKLEDPSETYEFFSKTAGEAYVTKVDSFQTNAASLAVNYLDNRSASAEKRARIDLLDLKEQGLGEAHIFFKSTIIRARMFFADPPAVKAMRLNYFLKVEKPSTRTASEMIDSFELFEKAIKEKGVKIELPVDSEDIEKIAKIFNENKSLDPIERGVSALLAFYDEDEPVDEEVPEAQEEEDLTPTTVNIFLKVKLPEFVLKIQSEIGEKGAFDGRLLLKQPTRQAFSYLERLLGKSERHAQNIGSEIIADIENATVYPPHIPDLIDDSEFVARTEHLIRLIEAKKLEISSKAENIEGN